MSNTTKSKGNIYSLAKLAKERLKTNSYTKVKGNVINTASTFANYISNQKTSSILNKTSTNAEKPTFISHDEELYKKVCYLIESHNTLNPVSYLIDKEVFASLDHEAKQFYINNLTQKYKFMKNRYYKEHSASLYI